jgi:hypothetical protein
MNSNRKIYWILSLLTVGSYVWVGYHLLHTHSLDAGTLCAFKATTGVPCPSCGITRSMLLLLQGNVSEAIWINPLGILAGVLLILIPIWIVLDFFRNRTTLLTFYTRSEEIIRTQKIIYIPLIVLVALNWIWNISKGL